MANDDGWLFLLTLGGIGSRRCLVASFVAHDHMIWVISNGGEAGGR